MLVNLNEMLRKAQQEHYAVGLFNAVNVEMARAVLETAEEMRAPVIVGTAEILLPAMGLERVAEYLLPMADKASVPVCVHYDHGLSFASCMQALRLGFTSIMYDCSTDRYEDNVAKVARMTEICHAMGVTVEGELGHVGNNTPPGQDGGRTDDPSAFYTDPALAEDYGRRTGVDALAIAVGNAHGDYPFPPKLDFQRIAEIAGRTAVPLVLHGGSGLSELDFRTAIGSGICKVNIFTELDKAGKAGVEEGLAKGARTMMELIPYEIAAMKAVVRDKISLFGSAGRA